MPTAESVSLQMPVPGASHATVTRVMTPQLAVLLLSLLLFAYVLLRALLLTLTPDESQSYLMFVRQAPWWPQFYDTDSANNHLLNTWLMRSSTSLFGIAPVCMRLPNVLAHALFLWFTVKLSFRCSRGWTAVLFFALLNLHPYLLDFFSLARGYGLSMGFLAAAVYYAYVYVCGGNKPSALSGFLVAAMLATFASFVLLNVFLAGAAVLLLFGAGRDLQRGQPVRYGTLLRVGAATAVLLLILLPHLMELRKANALYYGSQQLWDGLVSVLEKFEYDVPYAGGSHSLTRRPLLIMLLLAALVLPVLVARKTPRQKCMTSFPLFTGALFWTVLLLLVLQRLSMGVLYPQNRTGIFLLWLMMLVIVTCSVQLAGSRRSIRVTLLLCIPVLLHFVLAANLEYVQEWKTSAHVDRFLLRMKNTYAADHRKVRVVADGAAGLTLLNLLRLENTGWASCDVRWDTLPCARGDYYIVEPWSHRRRAAPQWILTDSADCSGTAFYRDPSLQKQAADSVHSISHRSGFSPEAFKKP